MVLVDSSAWIAAFRRESEVQLAVDGLLKAYEAQWCAPVRIEVLGGARADNRYGLEGYFSVIPYRRCYEEDWARAVALAWRIRDRGLTVPWLDVLIAALALHDDVRLYALDRHFEQIGEMTGLRLYRPGYTGGFTPDE